MDNKEVFEATARIGHEMLKVEQLSRELISKRVLLTTECKHEIVFEYNDNFPRPKKLFIYGHYYCPACGCSITCHQKSDIEETIFKNSRIIPLTNLSLLGTDEVFRVIRNDVYKNLGYYYDISIPTEELSLRMEEILMDLQTKYENPARGLRKILNRK